MVSGWYVVIGLIAIVFVVIRLINMKQDWAAKLVWVMFIFAAISISYMLINGNVKISKPLDVIPAVKTYFTWLGSFFSNVKTVTGDAINLTWSEFDNGNSKKNEKG